MIICISYISIISNHFNMNIYPGFQHCSILTPQEGHEVK